MISARTENTKNVLDLLQWEKSGRLSRTLLVQVLQAIRDVMRNILKLPISSKNVLLDG